TSTPASPWSASRRALRLSKGGNDAKLMHQSPNIPADVGIHDLGIHGVDDCDSVYGHFLVRGGDSHEFALVSAGNSPRNGQLFIFTKRVFDDKSQIRK